MLEIGKENGESKVEMQERAEVLGVVLPYFYTHRVINFDLNHPRLYAIVRALGKYQVGCSSSQLFGFDCSLGRVQVWRGLESVSRAIQSVSARPVGPFD